MSEKFTPGPWFTCKGDFADQVCSKPEYDKAIAAGDNDETACGESLVCETASNFANARLIASAPELCERLQSMADKLGAMMRDYELPEECNGIICGELDETNALLAKAKGQL